MNFLFRQPCDSVPCSTRTATKAVLVRENANDLALSINADKKSFDFTVKETLNPTYIGTEL